ncbi:coronin-7 isoform X2 [Tribolium castaneum]|uniref:coronin-7 isoform X2 n=1 Tax=Tribolium castaneum TaxID=7070 RepID=UPI0000D55DAC|nr:PREDICTED: coronin-7 isoform X2 [Tribolium castaneum]|eukprot:XP_972622.1 PREDICTED: coronin-7 isoform X2 [Tribolium castaneum]
MAWRFKASKYKNAAPIVPKPENYVRDICVGSYQTYGNNISASAKFMAFNWDHAGSSLAVLPLDDSGRKSKLMPLLHAHSDTVTDLEFSPFHDGLLATGSQDCLVKIWHIPETGLQESLSNPECTFSHKQRRVETVGFHPTADFLLHSTSYTTLTLWDLISGQEVFSNAEPSDVIQSVSWKRDGTLVATSSKDKQVRILDPRVEQACVKTANSHQSIKDSRIVWLGDSNRVLTTGFDAQRLRQIIVRDLRNFGEAEKSIELDCSTGILIPLYDADTGMLFLAGKGDTTIGYMEVTDKEPYLTEGIRHSGEQTKGACLVPKRALNVMQGEVNRILQLTSTCVIPITYQVPRKTYRDFHADLYPDTPGYKTELTAAQWLNGKNIPLPKISLDPSKRENGEEPIIPRLGPKPFTPPKLNESESSFDKVFSVPAVPSQPQQSNGVHEPKTPDSQPPTPSQPDKEIEEEAPEPPKTPSTAERRKLFESNTKENEPEDNFDVIDQSGNFERASPQRSSIAERRKMYENRSQSVQETPTIIEKAGGSPVMLRRKDSFKNRKNTEDVLKEDNNRKSGQVSKQMSLEQSARKSENFATPTPKRTSTVFGRVSKFRHLKGTPAHKSLHIENIRNLSRQISGECDGFHANPDRVAVPLSGPGGKIAIFELSKTGKLPDGVIPALVHGSNIMDFAWDPFDNQRLAVACDDGVIKLWKIPETGLSEPTNEAEAEFNAHPDKIYFIKFHPTARDVLASGSYDMTIKIWDLATLSEKIVLRGHTDQMFSFAWSPCGAFCSTVSKDGKIRIYKPRAGDLPIREGKGPVGSRGARIVWALDGGFIVVTGFDKVSERQIMVFKATDLSNPLNTIGLDVSPAILIPFYDEDSSTLFVTGKGDLTIYAFEITEESPYICPLSHHRCNNLHQGLSFLPKNVCDVSNVEFAKALRLTNNTIEPLSFTVPRIKTELFQDDLFPPTKVTWKPSLSSTEWYNNKDKTPQRISLKPEGMDLLSESQGQTNPERTINKSASTPFIGASQPYNRLAWNADLNEKTKMKQEELQKSVSNRMEVNLKLEQDEMEGVDEKEWTD